MEKAPPIKRPRYDAAFRAETLLLASESRSTPPAARALNINAKLLYAWQKAAQEPLAHGTRRLRVELREKSYWVGRQALRTGLRRRHRRALPPKAFAPCTTDSTHGRRCAPNWLLDQPRLTQAKRFRVSDIPYLPLANGTCVYLCAFLDVCTKHVVGWQVRADMPEALVISPLQALLTQRPAPGLIVHSDRGGAVRGQGVQSLAAWGQRPALAQPARRMRR